MTRRKDPRAGLPQPRGTTARTARVIMRVEPATKKRWIDAADREGLTLSRWIEEAADTAFARGSSR